MMRRLFLALLIAAVPLWPASAAPLSDQDKTDLARVSDYLNGVKTMQGGFVQIGPDGSVAAGKFYISKPGRMRFDYDPPTPTLVVSNGLSIRVYNTKLNTSDSYPLASTPLNLLLSDHVSLARSSYVTGIERQEGSLIVKARATDRSMSGNITIVFAEPSLELRQWTVVDAQGLATTVSLRDVQTGMDLSDTIFGVKPGK
jgi:outer membrane lipoprotein-sorting protein